MSVMWSQLEMRSFPHHSSSLFYQWGSESAPWTPACSFGPLPERVSLRWVVRVREASSPVGGDARVPVLFVLKVWNRADLHCSSSWCEVFSSSPVSPVTDLFWSETGNKDSVTAGCKNCTCTWLQHLVGLSRWEDGVNDHTARTKPGHAISMFLLDRFLSGVGL